MASIFGRALITTKTNKSGGSLAKGDVVIVDGSNDNAVTTTTTSAYTGVVGVVVEENGIANNATGRVQFGGHVSLVTPNASVTRGHYATTHTVAKQATDGGASRVVGAFGVFTTGGTTPEADLFTQPDGSSAAGGITRTTQGTTSAGASFKTRGTILKKLTLATDGVVANIHAFIKGDGTNLVLCVPVVYSDVTGTPTNLLFGPGGDITGAPARVYGSILNTTVRDFRMPGPGYLPAGDYWFGVWTSDNTATSINVAYTATGGTGAYVGGGTINQPEDSSIQALTTNSEDYSIYIDVLR